MAPISRASRVGFTHLCHHPILLALIAVCVGWNPVLVSAAEPAKPRTPQDALTPVPDWPERHEQLVARAREGKIDLLFLGNSITDFWPKTGPDSWTQFAKYHAADFGISGDHTEHVLWRIAGGELDGISPKVVVILIGTNNVDHCPDEKPEWAAAGVNKVVTMVREKLPGAKVLLMGIFPRNEKDSPLRHKIAAINQIISKLDDGKNVRYLDIGNKFLDADGNISTDAMPDLLHPNAKGYDIWYEAMRPVLHEMLGEPATPASAPAAESAKLGRVDPYSPRTAEDAVTPTIRWQERHDKFVARAREGNIDLLFLGDSITDNWPTLGKESWDKLAPYKPANFGIGGDRTEHVLWRVLNGELDGISPKVVVLNIGTNNIGDGNHADEKPEWAAAGVEKIVEVIRQKLPQSKVLLLAIFSRNGKDSELNRKAIRVNQIISKLDDGKAIRYLDIGKHFLDENGETPNEIMPDKLHPYAKGYEIWFEAMRPTLDEMMRN